MAGFAAVMLVAGCGGKQSLPDDYNAVPVPKRTDYTPPTPQAPPLGFATARDTIQSRVEKVLWPQIRRGQAVVPVDCDGSPEPDGTSRTIRCSALWEGVQVPFDVTVSGAGKPFYNVQVKQLKGLFLADAVRDAWASENLSGDAPRSCDGKLPRAALVPLNEPLPYRCAFGTNVYTPTISMRDDHCYLEFNSLED